MLQGSFKTENQLRPPAQRLEELAGRRASAGCGCRCQEQDKIRVAWGPHLRVDGQHQQLALLLDHLRVQALHPLLQRKARRLNLLLQPHTGGLSATSKAKQRAQATNCESNPIRVSARRRPEQGLHMEDHGLTYREHWVTDFTKQSIQKCPCGSDWAGVV
jgi:hypothetical protein